MSNLPMHGVTETQLPPEREEALAALQAALAAPEPDATEGLVEVGRRLREVAGRYPTFLDA